MSTVAETGSVFLKTIRMPSSCRFTSQFLATGYSSKLEYADAIQQKMTNVRSATVSMNLTSLAVVNQVNKFTWHIKNILSNAPRR